MTQITLLYWLLVLIPALVAAAAVALAIVLRLEVGITLRGWRSLSAIVPFDLVAATVALFETMGRAPPEPGGGASARISTTSALMSASVSILPKAGILSRPRRIELSSLASETVACQPSNRPVAPARRERSSHAEWRRR